MRGSRVLVYAGDGVSPRALAYCLEGLREELDSALNVREVTAAELTGAAWEEETGAHCGANSALPFTPSSLAPPRTALLVFPGGADKPYCAALDGDGTARIRRFVEQGGHFLGLCAGAYFASARCEFELGTALEVAGPRQLAFFPGTAVGSVAPGFCYASEAGAVAVQLCFGAALQERALCYLNGGPAFVGADLPSETVDVLARYAPGQPGDGQPAALCCRVGNGVAVLCGPHPEMPAARAPQELPQLLADDQGRRRFWRSLLAAARVALRSDAPLPDPPRSPLRSIAPGFVLPEPPDLALPRLLPPMPVPARGSRSDLGPLRSTSTLDLQTLPEVPVLQSLRSAAERFDQQKRSEAPSEWVAAPLQRLSGWLAATAGLLAASRLLRPHLPLTSRAATIAAGAAGCALGAGVRFGAPRPDVPITAQSLAACLCGLVLGPADGLRATALYATAAAAGLPVLAPGPRRTGAHASTAGFVAGFLVCAAAVGTARQRCVARRASPARFAAAAGAAAAFGQLATVLMGGAWAALLLASEGVAPDAAAGGTPRPWLVELALHSVRSVPPFLPGLITKAALTGACAALAQPALVGPQPPLQPGIRRLLE